MLNSDAILENSKKIKTIDDFVQHNISSDSNVFVCLVGEDSKLISEITKMDNVLRGKTAYVRLSQLPMLPPEKAALYEQNYNGWLRSFKRKASASATTYNEKESENLSQAISQTINVFRKTRKNITDSIEKNFVMKLLFWYDYAFENLNINVYQDNGMKIVGENVERIQEYLFYYMAALTGCDVMLIQNKIDLDTPLRNLNLSARVILGHLGSSDIPKFTRIFTQISNNRVTPAQSPQRPNRQNSPYPPSQSSGNNRVTIPPRPDRQNSPYRPSQSLRNNRVIFSQSSNGMVDSFVTGNMRPSSNVQPLREKSFEELAQNARSVVQIFAIRRQNSTSDSFQILGSGSGIMISSGGYILTNNHVARTSCEFAVRVENDTNVYFTNRMIKYHSDFDLAIIRIDRKLTPLPIYQGPKPLVRGQRVVAIGSPQGLFNTVSDGIISGFRTIDMVDMIQFTAPISSGSSGGALLNMYGELIGISTAGIDDAQNINFAVDYKTILNFTRGLSGLY